MENSVFSVLVCLVSQDVSPQAVELRKAAETQLNDWEKNHPGFLRLLLEISLNTQVFSNNAVDSQTLLAVSQLSLLRLRKTVTYQWNAAARSTSKSTLVAEEKEIIRSTLLTFNAEAFPLVICKLVSEIIAEIAKFDYPSQWPNLLDNLVSTLQQTPQYSPNTPQSHSPQKHALFTIYKVIKALCAKKTPISKKSLEMIAPNVFSVFSEQFYNSVNLLLQKLEPPQQQYQYDDLEYWLYCAHVALKCLKSLVVSAWEEPDRHEPILRLFNSLLGYLNRLLNLNYREALLQKIILAIGKFYLGLQELRIISFLKASSMDSFSVIHAYFTFLELPQSHDDEFKSRLQLQSFHLISALLTHRSLTRAPKELQRRMADNDVEAINIVNMKNLIMKSLFTQEFVTRLFNVVVTKFLVISSEEWEIWISDPEQIVMEWDAESSEESTKGCAKALAAQLVQKFTPYLVPVIIDALKSSSESSLNPNDFMSIVQRDAIYCVTGLSVRYLVDDIPLESWVDSRLFSEYNIGCDSQGRDVGVIIRRRIPQLIQKIDYETPLMSLRKKLYAFLISIMQISNEPSLLVRLEALSCFANCIDFVDPDLFNESTGERPEIEMFLGEGVKYGVEILGQCSDAEVRKIPSRDIRRIVEETRYLMAPHIPLILEALPKIWSDDGSGTMTSNAIPEMRTNVLQILLVLVKAASNRAEVMWPLAIPYIAQSVDRNQPYFVYLHIDAVILWNSLIHAAEQPSKPLIDLFPRVVDLLENGCEEIDRVFRLIQGYSLLSAADILTVAGPQLFTALTTQISPYSPKASVLAKCINTLMASCYYSGIFLNAAFLEILAPMLQKLWETAVHPETEKIFRGIWLYILARAAVFGGDWFVEWSMKGDLNALVEAWISSIDNQITIKHQMTVLMAISNVNSSQSTARVLYLKHFPGISGVFVSLVNELSESEGLYGEESFFHTHDPYEHGTPDDDDDSGMQTDSDIPGIRRAAKLQELEAQNRGTNESSSVMYVREKLKQGAELCGGVQRVMEMLGSNLGSDVYRICFG
ncbi:Importin-11 [Nowakowskiella sp. JEL0407]|nr:Importin-11 [Nowakowskiella sp. JEL0407]